jgi:hypothetical protein
MIYQTPKALLWHISYSVVSSLSAAKANDKPFIAELRELVSRDYDDFFFWGDVFLFALLLSFLISMSLRLDFTNHTASIMEGHEDLPANLIALEVVPAPKPGSPSEQLTAGVVIPYFIPVSFECPYFISSFLAWILANTIVMGLLAYGWLPEFGHFVFTSCIPVCALPMVILSVVGVSLVRGEVRRMWTYEERWSLDPADNDAAENSEKVHGPVDVKGEATHLVRMHDPLHPTPGKDTCSKKF